MTMLKRLEADGIRADLAAVTGLLSRRTREADPVGWMQFLSRKEHLECQLAELQSGASEPGAAVAVYFGGRPVIGSTGILASFSSQAVEKFQGLISSGLAAFERPLSDFGPIPQRDRSQMMITDVTRGSFGFVLEPAVLDDANSGVQMAEAVDSICDLLYRAGSPDEESFSEAFGEKDGRIVDQVAAFFRLLDDAGATLRLVDETRDFVLQRSDISLARARTDTLRSEEEQVTVSGRLYLLPASKRFELMTDDGFIKGVVTPECLARLSAAGADATNRVVGTVRTVKLRVRTIHSERSARRKSYALLEVGLLMETEPPDE
jgi:hypothetical protein